MPVDGFPDATRHKCCMRCNRWFEPDEGRTIRAMLRRPLDSFREVADVQTVSTESFICNRCFRRRTTNRVILGALLASALMGLLAYAFIFALEMV